MTEEKEINICPYCRDAEDFDIELDEDGFCPQCGYHNEDSTEMRF